jgi:hypothetical protein
MDQVAGGVSLRAAEILQPREQASGAVDGGCRGGPRTRLVWVWVRERSHQLNRRASERVSEQWMSECKLLPPSSSVGAWSMRTQEGDPEGEKMGRLEQRRRVGEEGERREKRKDEPGQMTRIRMKDLGRNCQRDPAPRELEGGGRERASELREREPRAPGAGGLLGLASY